MRRLAAELRRRRRAADLSREEASTRTGINNATLYRIETARARPQMRTLEALLTLYKVDAEQREYLTILCRDAAKQGWLRPYHSDLPEEYTAYISFEAEAAGVRNYESLFIPGLLQTEEYARAVIRGVIVDEAALRRLVGGANVMQNQLRRLLDLVPEPNVTLQVIPFGVGAHAGMPGALVLMDFSDPMDTDLVHIDSMAGALFLESDADVSRYATIFDNLRAVALSPDDSATLIAELASESAKGVEK
ncbi:MAG: helix-turn-helix domain-containing protein [Pseudonocardiaceae bacterium]